MFRLAIAALVLGNLIEYATVGYFIVSSLQHSECGMLYGCPNPNAYVIGVGIPLGIILAVLGAAVIWTTNDDKEDSR